jgi:hypothetical protein
MITVPDEVVNYTNLSPHLWELPWQTKTSPQDTKVLEKTRLPEKFTPRKEVTYDFFSRILYITKYNKYCSKRAMYQSTVPYHK